MIVVPFDPDHLRRILLQPGQAHIKVNADTDGPALAAQQSFTAMDGDLVLGCAGITPIWEGRGMAWALLDARAGRCFAAIHRAVLRMLELAPYRRVEAHVDVDFAAAQRWIRMLGFEHEGRARAYSPEGRDCDIFARIR